MSVASGPVNSGQASVEVFTDDGAGKVGGRVPPPVGVALTPLRADACPVSVLTDTPGEAYVEVGRHGTRFELWEREGQGFDSAVRGLVEAVVEGRYEEWVRLGRNERRVAAKGVFHLEDGTPRTVLHNTLGLLVERRPGWRHITYTPYR